MPERTVHKPEGIANSEGSAIDCGAAKLKWPPPLPSPLSKPGGMAQESWSQWGEMESYWGGIKGAADEPGTGHSWTAWQNSWDLRSWSADCTARPDKLLTVQGAEPPSGRDKPDPGRKLKLNYSVDSESLKYIVDDYSRLYNMKHSVDYSKSKPDQSCITGLR